MHDGVVLHSLRIRRKELPFVFLKKLDTREQFMTDLTETLARCPFTLVAAAIDKVRLRERDLQPENPQMRNRAFDSIQEKFDRGPNGELMGWGLEIYPRKTKGPDD